MPPVSTPPPPPPPPPRTVRRASVLLILVAGVSAASAALALVALAHLRAAAPALKRALLAAPDNPDDVHAIVRSLREPLHLDAGTGLLGLLLLAVSTWTVWRPTRAGRAVAWGSMVVLTMLLGIALASAPVYPSGSAPGADPVAQAYGELTPGWYPSLNSLVIGVEATTFVAILVLLGRSGSATFYAFRRGAGEAGLFAYARRDD